MNYQKCKWHPITDEMRETEGYHAGMPMHDCEVYITIEDKNGFPCIAFAKLTWAWVDDTWREVWVNLNGDVFCSKKDKSVIAWMDMFIPRAYDAEFPEYWEIKRKESK